MKIDPYAFIFILIGAFLFGTMVGWDFCKIYFVRHVRDKVDVELERLYRLVDEIEAQVNADKKGQ